MQLLDGELVLSPTDLTTWLGCTHATHLDLAVARQELAKPEQTDEGLDVLFRRGNEHEERYLQRLRDEGLTVVTIERPDAGRGGLEAAERLTVEAMAAGADVVYQATLFDGRWRGHADFLVKRTDRPGRWAWSYDIQDTKLARRLKVPALLQMATYAERLTVLQGIAPERLTVVAGDGDARHFAYRDVMDYARAVRARFETSLGEPDPGAEPVTHCDQCRWKPRCTKEWRDADHLSLVAFMRGDHRRALVEQGIATVRDLANANAAAITGVGAAARERIVAQAKLQIQERDTGQPTYELLPPEPGRGLALLPEPSPGDVFFDMEGDPYEGDHGLEYLWGLLQRDEFTPVWALDPSAEKAAFEAVIDRLTRAWAEDPGMHVYHYAPYERTRLTSLAARYATREDEVDRLLRGQRLVDLYAVVRQGLQVSKESYSIKKLEAFYGLEREDGVADAMGSVVAFERWLLEGDQAPLDDIAVYNEADCRSTQQLRDWLERLRVEGGGDVAYPRPVHGDGSPGEGVAVAAREAEKLRESLLVRLPADPAQASAQRLVADLLDWHRREQRPEWWEYFHRLTLSDEELTADSTALGELSGWTAVGTVKSSTIWGATFPPQDTKCGPGDKWLDPRTQGAAGTVVEISPEDGTITVKRATRLGAPTATGLVPGTPINTGQQRQRLMDLGRELKDRGWGPRPNRRAARDLLLREPPRIGGVPLRLPGERAGDALVRLAPLLDHSVLAVQGPPGTGKTYNGARMIVELLRRGQKVGVCGFSHKVIGNLLDAVAAEATAQGLPLLALQKAEEGQRCSSPLIPCTPDAADVRKALDAGDATLVAGTPWLYARDDMQEALDYLVVDEAGQMSLANVLAVGGCARNLVLLGDPQQLQQPVRGLHPEGADASALEHYLDGHATIPADRGLLLDETWRMHPDVADFVSERFYDGRLRTAPGCEHQLVSGDADLAGTGLRFHPIPHADNSAASSEEADAVRDLVEQLLAGSSWTGMDGVSRRLCEEDVLVLSPYNAQVHRLRGRLATYPGVRVGTVDKYQGQEAPVVLYSMATSSAVDAPRGLDFLYDLHRFDVALSRARGIVAVVCSPELLTPVLHDPDDVRPVNTLCSVAAGDETRPAAAS